MVPAGEQQANRVPFEDQARMLMASGKRENTTS